MTELHGNLIRPHAYKLGVMHRVIECLIIAFTLYLACSVYDIEFDRKYWFAALLVCALFLLIAETTNLYGSWRLFSLRQELTELVTAWIIVGLLLTSLAFLTKTSADYSRVVMIGWAALGVLILAFERVLLRVFLRTVRAHGRNSRLLAVAGSGQIARALTQQVVSAGWVGLTMAGMFDNRSAEGANQTQPVPSLAGDLHDLIKLAREGKVDYIYIALPAKEEDRILWLVNVLADTTASVFLVPDLFIFNMKQARWTSVNGIPVVSIYETPFDGLNGWMKRLEDLVLGTLILALIAIPMFAISCAVKLSSPGPVLFRQRRYGLNGKVVEVWKFRTMTVTEDGENIPQAQRGDARVTPLGLFLRRTSLDELPQFLNVLMGDMSIVGPRPHAVAHNEEYRGLIPGYMLRHKIKPGITGLAQVNGWRGETDTLEKMEKRVEFDLEYMQNWSLWLDLKIILLTVVRGFTDKNAY